jgi:hypothetical protein
MKRRVSLALLAALAGAPFALADETIVVTAVPLAETAAKLDQCLKTGCAPDQDIAASLAHAENQFIAGQYGAARSTLVAALGRNRKHRAAYPVPVSDLLRANSRVAEHMGEARPYKSSVLDMRDVLRDAFGPADARALVAQVEVGDSRAKLGFPDEARRIYGEVAALARANGETRIGTFADLRRAALAVAAADSSRLAEDRLIATKALRPLTENTDPLVSDFRLAARVLTARMASRAGDSAAIAALVAGFAADGGTDRPVLLSAKPMEQRQRTRVGGAVDWSLDQQLRHPAPVPGADTLRRTTATLFPDQWVDIGFWVNADGRVSDAEVLRGSRDQSWAAPVVANIAGRIYAPLKRQPGEVSPGQYQIERYSLTARWEEDARVTTGTRMRQRDLVERIERIDITPDSPVKIAAR